MAKSRRRNVIAALSIAFAASAAVSLPAFDVLRGLSLDALTALRWRLFEPNHNSAPSPTVVVGLDEETYRTPPFAGTPRVTWTREIGGVVAEIVAGGAKVVGFDLIFPTSIEQSTIAIGEETLGQRVRGFDRDYLRALASAARAGKLVLGELQHSDEPIRPSPAQRIAVGHQSNIRLLNVYSDPDGVVRRVPLTFNINGRPTTSMSVELASRALGAPLEQHPSGATTLAGYRIPGAIPGTMTLNFQGGGAEVPIFSLADLHACAALGRKEFFRRHFEGKVVLIGALLDAEDRVVTSKRFATEPERPATLRCANPVRGKISPFARDSIPGVYVHAVAVNNLIQRMAIKESGHAGAGAIVFALAMIAVVLPLLTGPAAAALSFVGVLAVWSIAAAAFYRYAIALPLLDAGLAGLLALAGTVGFRFAVADRDKRFLRNSFSLYLSPKVIESMTKAERLPELGGELRQVTVYFSDVAGFSSFSERVSPTELVALMNEYLSAMSEEIEAQGGLVDKYIGDAVVAVFGAPVDDADHARSAVRAALRCQERLKALNGSSGLFRDRPIAQRIGLNSGEALVGNIGSRRRFNYTAMGDVVNLASRLEGANQYLKTPILVSGSTFALARDAFLWREVDTIRVKGRAQPVTVYEPLAEAPTASAAQADIASIYQEGLKCWRSRDFRGAVGRFSRISQIDPPAAQFLARSERYISEPPADDWEPIFTLADK